MLTGNINGLWKATANTAGASGVIAQYGKRAIVFPRGCVWVQHVVRLVAPTPGRMLGELSLPDLSAHRKRYAVSVVRNGSFRFAAMRGFVRTLVVRNSTGRTAVTGNLQHFPEFGFKCWIRDESHLNENRRHIGPV